MSTARSSKSPKSTGASSKNANFSTGFSCPPPAYGITGLNQASSGGSHAIQPSHGLPDTQKRKVTARQSDGKQTEGATPAFHIRPAGDAYEQQADRIAEKITGQLQSGGKINRISEPVKPLRENGEKTEGQAVSPELASNIVSARGKGRPLPAAIRKPAEKALGRPLGDVRLHTGAQASSLNREVGSAAFAVQKDIFVRDGLDLSKPESQAMALHEAVHTQQQSMERNSINTPVQAMHNPWRLKSPPSNFILPADRGTGNQISAQSTHYQLIPPPPATQHQPMPPPSATHYQPMPPPPA